MKRIARLVCAFLAAAGSFAIIGTIRILPDQGSSKIPELPASMIRMQILDKPVWANADNFLAIRSRMRCPVIKRPVHHPFRHIFVTFVPTGIQNVLHFRNIVKVAEWT
jgi:hypothetical protein